MSGIEYKWWKFAWKNWHIKTEAPMWVLLWQLQTLTHFILLTLTHFVYVFLCIYLIYMRCVIKSRTREICAWEWTWSTPYKYNVDAVYLYIELSSWDNPRRSYCIATRCRNCLGKLYVLRLKWDISVLTQTLDSVF